MVVFDLKSNIEGSKKQLVKLSNDVLFTSSIQSPFDPGMAAVKSSFYRLIVAFF